MCGKVTFGSEFRTKLSCMTFQICQECWGIENGILGELYVKQSAAHLRK